MKVNQFLIFVGACITITFAQSLIRSKRAAYELPDGVEFFIPNIRTSFQCQNDGIFADLDNACQLFHVCITLGDRIEQHTFACGNKTLFNQFSMTCDHEENVRCEASGDFYYLTQLIGQPKEFLHTENDVERAAAVGFGNRLRK